MSEKRKLTPFLAHEMLFDFATDHLDPDRKIAIENFIKDDRESQNLLAAIRRGIAYAESLRSIELSDELLVELDQAENFVSLSKRLARWSEWPDTLRWSIIALGVSLCTAALVVAIPWKSVPLFKSGPTFDSSTVQIARVESRNANSEDPSVSSVFFGANNEDQKENESGPLEGSGDEEFTDDGSSIPKRATPVVAAEPVVAATPVAAVKVPVPVIKSTPVPVVAKVEPAKASRGFVYRAFMTLSSIDDIAPKITQQMKELGAEKAGEVELGWRRGSGRYYHFWIPDANEQKLLESLRVYGPVRISKDPHPRVMPEGQVRFILWIESGT